MHVNSQRLCHPTTPEIKTQLVNVLDLNFKSPKPLGQQVVNGRENDKEDEAENAHDDRHEHVNDAHDLEWPAAENYHGDPDESVDETHQDIERGQYLAGLKNGDADQLLFHSFAL